MLTPHDASQSPVPHGAGCKRRSGISDAVLRGTVSSLIKRKSYKREGMARPGRFELPTLCLEGRRSIQLSYGRILGYSIDSTKVGKPIRHPILAKSWSNLGNLEQLEQAER